MKIKKPLFGFWHKVDRLLGIDIRRNFARLVELSYCNYSYQLEACAHIELGEIDGSDEAIITAIKNTLKQNPSKTKDTAIALSHLAAIFKEVEVDANLSAEETIKFLRFNLAQQVSDSKTDISFDYQVIDSPTPTNSNTTLQVIAVRHERVGKLVALLQAANLKPKIIDVDVYALERAVRWQLKNIEGLVAIINIDYGNIFIVVIDSKKIVYVYEDFVGNESLGSIAQVVEQLDLKLQLLHSVLSQPLGQIILAGEKAVLFGLDDAVNSQLNIHTMIANPFLGMQLSPAVSQELIQKIAPKMLISCGLALRVDDEYKN